MYQEFYQLLLEINHGMAELFQKTQEIYIKEEAVYERIIDFCSGYGILYRVEINNEREKEYKLFDLQF